MSFSLNPMKTVRVIDPRLNFYDEREYGILTGGSQISWKPYTSTSFSNTSFNFSCPPPNPGICIDPRVYVNVPVRIDFTGTNPNVGANLLQDNFDSFRAFPLSSVIQTLTVRINNSAASINLADVIHALTRYNTPHKIREFDYSLTPCMLDYFQSYTTGQGSVRNPLSSFRDNSWETTRGSFPYVYVLNTPTAATISANLTEPLFLSPLLFGKGASDRNGFIGVQTFDVQMVLSNNLSRMWSHDASSASIFTNITVTFGQPSLLFTYITPKLLEPIPRSISYSYMIVDRYPTDNNTAVLTNSTFTYSSNNIQLQSIPRRMYLYARQRNSDQTFTSTDTYAALNSISINYNNYSGLLSSASPFDLYNISKKNGCNLSWPEWSGSSINLGVAGLATTNQIGQSVSFNDVGAPGAVVQPLVGSILCLDFAIDIGLDDIHAPGEIYNSQLQITATFTNINPNTITYTFYIVMISEGIWTIENLNSVPQIGILSKEDILNAKASPYINYSSADNIYGGDFLGKFKKFGNKIYRGIKDIAPYAIDAGKIAMQVAPYILPLLGLGEDQDCDGGVMIGGKKMPKIKGSSLIARSQLRKRIQ